MGCVIITFGSDPYACLRMGAHCCAPNTKPKLGHGAVRSRLDSRPEAQLKALESRAKGQLQFAHERDVGDELLPNPVSPRRRVARIAKEVGSRANAFKPSRRDGA